MTNKIENQENLQNNLSVQELQEIIADDNISALDKKIPKITKLGESENFDNIYIDKRNSLTSQLEAHKAEIELGNIAKKYTKEEQIDKQDFKASNPFEFQ